MRLTFARNARTLFFDGWIRSLPPYLRMFWPKKSKPLDMRDGRLLWRESQTTVAQETFHKRPDLLFKDLFRDRCNDEVVAIPDEMNLGETMHRMRWTFLWETFPQLTLQPIQGHVRQHRRDDTALRCAIVGRIERGIVHEPGFQPLAQNALIRRDIGEKPIVTDPVKARHNVAFENPLRRRAPRQCSKALSDCVSGGPFRPEAIGTFVRCGLGDGTEREQVQRPASRGLSSSGFPVVASCRCSSGCKRDAVAAADSRGAATRESAVVFWLGVRQISPSTPGVDLPLFSVTRRTASALPLNEWVSRRCKDATLFHLPSCVAFTMRAWRRRTFR